MIPQEEIEKIVRDAINGKGDEFMTITLSDLNLDYTNIAAEYKIDDIEKVKEKCEMVFNEALSLFPDNTVKQLKNIVLGSIGYRLYEKKDPVTYAKETGANENKCVVLATSSIHDKHGITKRMIWKDYKENPTETEAKGKMAVVRMAVDKLSDLDGVDERYAYVKKSGNTYNLHRKSEDGWIDTGYKNDYVCIDGKYTVSPERPRLIPVESRERFSSNDVNPEYGKPLPFVPERDFIAVNVESGDIWLAHGDIGNGKTVNGVRKEPEAYVNMCHDVSIFGTNTPVQGKPYSGKISAIRNAVENREPFTSATVNGEKITLWNCAELLLDTDWAVEVDDIEDLRYGYFVVKGTVGKIDCKDTSVYLNVRGDDDARGVRLSSWYKTVVAAASDIAEGDEVIVIGEKISKEVKDQRDENGKKIYKIVNELIGIVANPANDFSAQLAMMRNAMGKQ